MDAKQISAHFSETERDCVLRFISILAERLGKNLVQIWLFGSTARGDVWPDWMPMHSDIDLLVLSNSLVPPEVEEELVNETYPLFLACGRQISPQFRTMAQFRSSGDERTRVFMTQVRAEGYIIYAFAKSDDS